MLQTVQFNADMLRRYDISGPRYTSYPTAVQFTEEFDELKYREAAAASNDDPIPRPLSLYVHVPFCHSPCFYCGCMRIITRDPLKGQLYLNRLNREIEMQAELFDRDRVVEQLHFGGGTPTFLTDEQLEGLIETLGRHFTMAKPEDREFSVEIDPRTVDPARLQRLAEMGFNRVSLGVQDFDPEVQKAVNRIQPVDDTLAVLNAARDCGIESVNLDLIYGLPKQNLAGFGRTLDIVTEARPARIALYSYAHLPRLFKAQRQIDEATLPSGETKLALLELAIERLTKAGYVYVGMDHFALPDDELVIAQQNGDLHRNFQGYSTRADCDLVGLGVSSIGKIGDTYSQNRKTIDEYYAAIDAGKLPAFRGVQLDRDDILRRDVIQRVMCQGELNFESVEKRWNISFGEYFQDALPRLEELHKDGLIVLDQCGFEVTAAGRLLLRIVGMVFDKYHHNVVDAQGRFSKVI